MRLFKRTVSIITLGSLISLTLGCSLLSQNSESSSSRSDLHKGAEHSQSGWLKSGSILIARPLPEISTVTPARMLGFLPTPQISGRWISIDRDDNSVTLMDGTKEITKILSNGEINLPAGRFELVHKQQRPLWYAPPEYFKRRGLLVPPEGDSERYLKGALGEYAIFIDATTALHCAPLESEELQGIRLSEEEIRRLFSTLEIGDTIIVK